MSFLLWSKNSEQDFQKSVRCFFCFQRERQSDKIVFFYVKKGLKLWQMQKQKGHANIEIILDIYAEVTDMKKTEATENLSRNLHIF